jgi:hypothetical protein
MPNIQMLNNVEHQNVRVITDRGADYGDNVHFVMTFPIEFRRIQACFPIFFQKDANTGKFFPMALLGVEEGQNLFLGEDGWDATYVPLMLQRGPFIIGFQQDAEAPEGKRSVVSIDMDNPRISETDGEPLFLPHGGTTDFLSSMTRVLEDIQYGHQMNEEFVDALLEFDLIESVAMEVELNNGAKRQLLGLYTINEDRLEQLDGEALGKLHSKHHLLPIYMILASLSSFRTLIDKMNERLAGD